MKRPRDFGVLRTEHGDVPIRNRHVSRALVALQTDNRNMAHALEQTKAHADAMAAKLDALARSRWVRLGRALRVLPR